VKTEVSVMVMGLVYMSIHFGARRPQSPVFEFRFLVSGFWFWNFGFRVSEFLVSDFGSRDSGFGLRESSSGVQVSGFEYRISGAEQHPFGRVQTAVACLPGYRAHKKQPSERERGREREGERERASERERERSSTGSPCS